MCSVLAHPHAGISAVGLPSVHCSKTNLSSFTSLRGPPLPANSCRRAIKRNHTTDLHCFHEYVNRLSITYVSSQCTLEPHCAALRNLKAKGRRACGHYRLKVCENGQRGVSCLQKRGNQSGILF